jgi:hypothetical protein
MRCTDCRKEIKPVVAIDIDGTMGMYHQHFLQFASGYLNQRIKNYYVANQPFKEWFCTNYRCSVDVWHDVKLAYRQGGLKRTMPAYSIAKELCASILEADAELWVTTTRPYIRHDNIDPDTREWLRRHNIKYDYLIYDGDKYKKLAQLVGKERVCAVLDDLPEEIDDANNLFEPGVAIFRQNSFNRAYNSQYAITANNLEMAWRMINDRIKKWNALHGQEEPVPSDDGSHLAAARRSSGTEVG